MTTAIDKELYSYIELLDVKQKQSLLSVIKSFLNPLERHTISLEEYNKELEDSEAEIDRGEFYTHDEVVEMSKSWTRGK